MLLLVFFRLLLVFKLFDDYDEYTCSLMGAYFASQRFVSACSIFSCLCASSSFSLLFVAAAFALLALLKGKGCVTAYPIGSNASCSILLPFVHLNQPGK